MTKRFDIFHYLRKGFFLYLIVGLVFVWLVDAELAYQNRLTGLKHAEEDLKEFEAGRGEVDLAVFKRALRYYRELLKRMPKVALAHSALGFCYYYLGQPEAAIAHYKKALELDPFWYSYDWDLGVIYFRLGDYTASRKHLRQAAGHLDEAVYQYKVMAERFHVRGREDIRHESLRMLLRIQDDEINYYILMGENYLRLGKVDRMFETALGGLKNHPDNPGLNYQAGRAVLGLADCRRAWPYFQRAMEAKDRPASVAFYTQICEKQPGVALRPADDAQWVLVPGQTAVPEENWSDLRLHLNPDLILMRYLAQ